MKTDSNARTAMKLLLVSVAMFGFGYALVPLYDVFCDITGLNGKTGIVSAAEANNTRIDKTRLVTVEFDTNVNSELPWKFSAQVKKMSVHPGEINEAIFVAENLSDQTIVAQAVPSVASAEASMYFNKTECFCFTQQTLIPGERKEMPVRFIVDPEIPGKISTMTLSYTFFPAPGNVASIETERLPGRL